MSKSPTNNPLASSRHSTATLWLLNGNAIDEHRLASFAARLGASERLRHSNFLRPLRAREFLLGRILLRDAARHILGPDGARMDVAEREHAAPAVSFPDFSTPPFFYFSVSHSHGWVACLATTACAVGLDIEDKTRLRDFAALSAAAFDEAEQQWLAGLERHRRPIGFFRLWNNKEALYKLRSNAGRTTTPIKDEMIGAGWNCRVIDHPVLHIGLCATQELVQLEVVEVQSL